MATTTPTLSQFYHSLYLRNARSALKPKTRTEYERLFRKLIEPEFGNRKLHTFSRRRIMQWHANLAATTPYQANRALAVLSAILSYAEQLEEIAFNPARGIRRAPEKKRRVYLDREKLERLLHVIKFELEPEEGAFLLFMLYTGARPGEVKALRWEWLDDNGVFQLPDSKTGARNIYAPPPALAALSVVASAGERRTGRVFPSELNPTKLWRRVRRLTGIKERLYDLRHTFASEALSAGLSLEVIGQMLGHSRADTTKRYAHLQTETGVSAAAAVAERIGG